MAEEFVETLVTDRGTLTAHFRMHTPMHPHDELPDAPCIYIDYIQAEPEGNRLLRRHAGELMALIRKRLNSDRPMIFQPANGEMGNDEKQRRIEAYYLSCGFIYLPSAPSKFWMMWPDSPPGVK